MGTQQRKRIVIDRLPPILILQYLPGRLVSDDKEIRFFDDITVTYYQPSGKKKKVYVAVGCILCTGPAQEHFIARWKQGNSFFHYNSFRSPQVKVVKSFLDRCDGVAQTDTVRMVFYADERSARSAEKLLDDTH